jgi:hypothetical protein
MDYSEFKYDPGSSKDGFIPSSVDEEVLQYGPSARRENLCLEDIIIRLQHVHAIVPHSLIIFLPLCSLMIGHLPLLAGDDFYFPIRSLL